MKRVLISQIKPNENVKIAGHIEKIREQKTMQFVVLKDVSGYMQVTIEKDKHPEIAQIISSLTRHSFVNFIGTAVLSSYVKMGGIEFIPSQIEVESISSDIPIDGESSQDLRMDYRWIDLREESKVGIFKARTMVEHFFREFFISKGFIEIHTPKITLQSSEGGADVFTMNYYNQKACLTQSPQFYKQMSMSAGFDKTFEIGPYYRSEKSHTNRHTSEPICLDFEVSHITSHHDVMDIVEEWMKYVFGRTKDVLGDEIKRIYGIDIEVPNYTFPRFKLSEVKKIFEEEYGMQFENNELLDLDTEGEKLISEYCEKKYGSSFVFITDYPFETRAFYTMRSSKDSKETRSFDLIWKGLEMCSGAQREHRYDLLIENIKNKNISVDSMNNYIDFFRYGAPTHGGIGLGIDRFIAKLLNQPTIKETIFLFRGPSRIIP